MKKILMQITLLLFFVTALAPQGSAEFYRYRDAHGNVIYTDDLSKVPEEQRTQAEIYEESPTQSTSTSVQTSVASSAEQQAADVEALQKEGLRLLGIKAKLDEEYNALASENNKLKAEQKEAVTPEQIKAVNKKVVSFNTRFQAYQEKSAAYEADVKTYNKHLSAVESKTQPGTETDKK